MATCKSLEFFAEYLIASYLADGTKTPYVVDKTYVHKLYRHYESYNSDR